VNGGPHFKFNEAVSLEISCDTQEEIDYYCDALDRRRP
jgi:predicted 3-demethylubiquinone-9 3-methyltransferase (glyoxalase superfamily)